MAQITTPMRQKITSLIHSVRTARIATQHEIIKATNDGRIADRNNLIGVQRDLDEQFARAGQMEIDYISSNLDPSDAEKILAEAAEKGRKLVANLNSVAKILSAAARLAQIIKDLAGLIA
jgi:hypothetical protein